MTERKKQVCGLCAVLLTWALFRLVRLGCQGLFLDEAWSWAVSRLSVAQILQRPLYEAHPPLYYLWLKAVLAVLPPTEAGIRALSVLCSLTALAVVLVFAARWWDMRAALYAGWFVALSSFDVYYAQEGRMYTLLGLLWLLGYVLLAAAMRGHPRLLVAWGLVQVAMVWTNFYGFVVVALCLASAWGFWGWRRLRGRSCPLSGKWLAVGTGLAIVGSLPAFFLLLLSPRAGSAGGAWIPRSTDLLTLFALWSVGLTAARTYFLDSAHQVMPPLAPLSLWVWVLVGILLSGWAWVWGMWQGWKSDGGRRWAAVQAFLLTSVPVGIAFGFAFAFERRMWALKPFLGAAYLFYLWSGIGLSRLPYRFLRWGVAVAALGVSLVSVIPYHTTWQKTDAALAFHSLPPASEEHWVLLDRAYTAPVAFYYLGPEAQVWGIMPKRGVGFVLVQTSSKGVLTGDFQRVDCDTPTFQRVTDVWVYGPASRIRQEWAQWPSCLGDKRLWVFENDQWVAFSGNH